MLENLAILAYLAANCFSVLSNQLLKFFVFSNNWILSDKLRSFIPEGACSPVFTYQPELYVVIFHTNIITMFVYIIIHFILKQKGRINFTLKETFCTKEEIFQILLFSIPILASSYKLYLAEKMDFNRIEIAAMIKPFCVSMLALVLLKEKTMSTKIGAYRNRNTSPMNRRLPTEFFCLIASPPFHPPRRSDS